MKNTTIDMKRALMALAVSMCTVGAFAQKIDVRLTQLVQKAEAKRRAVAEEQTTEGQKTEGEVVEDAATKAKVAAIRESILRSNTKAGISMRRKLQQNPALVMDTIAVKERLNANFYEDGSLKCVTVLARLKEGSACPTALLESKDIEVKDVIGRTVILKVPAERLMELEDIEEITRVSADGRESIHNDIAREKTKATYIDGSNLQQLQENGLSTGYSGKGVVVGVVDRGIDYQHAAFRKSNGDTRIKKALWHDDKKDKLLIYTEEDILDLVTDDYTESHGSHTSCTAAGSSVTGCNNQGFAPDADLVLCGLGANLYGSDIISSIKQVFNYAETNGQPAVVNLSIGGSWGFHDGSEMSCLASMELTENGTAPGKIIVYAAGNEGSDNLSICQPLGAASGGYNLKTIVGTGDLVEYEGEMYAEYLSTNIFAYTNEASSKFTLTYKTVDITTGKLYSLLHKPLYDKDGKAVTSLDVTSDQTEEGQYYAYLCIEDELYYTEPNLRLAICIIGKKGANFVMTNSDPNALEGFTSNDLDGFTDGGGDMSISVSACTDAVISVGAYNTRLTWKAINDNSYKIESEDTDVEGSVASFSSYGIDDNGISRPDVVAPGNMLISAYNKYDSYTFTSDGIVEDEEGWITHCLTKFGRKNYYGVKGGTSMATPCVTGIIAQWLQADPTLSVADVRKILQETSDNDQFTTDPSTLYSGNLIQAGAGKINALAGLKYILGTQTDIIDLEADGTTAASAQKGIFNVAGQRLSKPTKGINLINGKKVYVP